MFSFVGSLARTLAIGELILAGGVVLRAIWFLGLAVWEKIKTLSRWALLGIVVAGIAFAISTQYGISSRVSSTTTPEESPTLAPSVTTPSATAESTVSPPALMPIALGSCGDYSPEIEMRVHLKKELGDLAESWQALDPELLTDLHSILISNRLSMLRLVSSIREHSTPQWIFAQSQGHEQARAWTQQVDGQVAELALLQERCSGTVQSFFGQQRAKLEALGDVQRNAASGLTISPSRDTATELRARIGEIQKDLAVMGDLFQPTDRFCLQLITHNIQATWTDAKNDPDKPRALMNLDRRRHQWMIRE